MLPFVLALAVHGSTTLDADKLERNITLLEEQLSAARQQLSVVAAGNRSFHSDERRRLAAQECGGAPTGWGKYTPETSLLQKIGIDVKTDKAYLHFYCPFYDQFLEPLRHTATWVAEVGVRTGASVKMWERYFSRAKLLGMDITWKAWQDKDAWLRNHSDRVTLKLADQAKRKQLKDAMASTGPFDVFVEDGNHALDQQQITLSTVWPMIKSGGFFIWEDIHSSLVDFVMDKGQRDAKRNHVATTLQLAKVLRDRTPLPKMVRPSDKWLPNWNQIVSEVDFCQIWSNDVTRGNKLSITAIIKKR